MEKITRTYYYIQAQEGDGLPEIVHHTIRKRKNKKDKYLFKFLDRKIAEDLLDAEKKLSPTTSFRIVTCKEVYNFGEWV